MAVLLQEGCPMGQGSNFDRLKLILARTVVKICFNRLKLVKID